MLSKISIRTLLLITKLLFFSTHVMELKMLTLLFPPLNIPLNRGEGKGGIEGLAGRLGNKPFCSCAQWPSL